MQNIDKILLFGATGVVGTGIEKACSETIQCIALGHGDIDITVESDVQDAIEDIKPTIIINCVAKASIDPCEKDPQMALDIHCRAVVNLAKECQQRDICLIQPSSHAIFDGTKDEPYLESDIPKATSVYAASKLISERIVAAYCPRHYIIRFPTLFGPRRNNSPGFVDKVINWIKEGRELKIADDKMDSPTYSLDATAAVISLIRKSAPSGIYHIANQGWVSYFDFVLLIKDLLGADNKIHRAKDHDFHSTCFKPLRTGLKSSKIKSLRNYEIALKEYIINYVR
jgi:dTDP-4-dehydrorhamnose reductase